MLNYFNTFSDSPPSSLYSLETSSSVPSVTYNSSAQAVDLSLSGISYNLWLLSGITPANELSDFSLEVDIEFVSAYSSYKDIGLVMLNHKTYHYGYRLRYLTSAWSFSKMTGWDSSTSLMTGTSTPTFNVGDRRVLKITRTNCILSAYIDGVLLGSVFNVDYKTLIPAVWFSGGTIRIHSVNWSYFGDSELVLHGYSTKMLWANNETRAQACQSSSIVCKATNKPVLHFSLRTPLDLIRPPLRSELGFIQGIVTRKSQVAAGQHVVCLNSRFNLVAETVSADDGSYRFDSLSIYDTYIVIAQDNWDFKYAPVGADRRTPEAYS